MFANNGAVGRDGFTLRSVVANGGDAQGGALSLNFSQVGITNCAFVANEARGGNGMVSGTRPPSAGSAAGGALFNQSGLNVLNSTFGFNMAVGGTSYAGDTSTGRGGALANSGILRIGFSTIASNVAMDTYVATVGGGCYNSGVPIDLQGTIFAGNMAQGVANNGSGTFTDSNYNISSDGTIALNVASSARNTDPRLGPLINFGGPTPVFPLAVGSPALDMVPLTASPGMDQRRVLRPQNLRGDIGACEQTYLRIDRVAGQKVRLAYDGVPNEGYTLLSTGDWKSWSEIETRVADATGRVVFSELDGAGAAFLKVKY